MRNLALFLALTGLSLTTSAFAASDKKTNISTNPLALAFGSINVNADFKMSEKMTLGPSFAYSSYTSGSSKATGIGVGANLGLYLSNNAFSDSWVFNLGIDYANASNSSTSASVSGLAFGGTIGYGWFWDGGFNIGLGVGAQYITFDFGKIGLGSISGVLPRLLFTIGYAF
ncbi:MAG: DUF3575 domain-containing protein [Bdellovibrionales bacterium]|nr:DUF3575 domain-containing protein [Bdellovibrionales bacterium]